MTRILRQVVALFILALLGLFSSPPLINRVVTAQTERQWPTRLLSNSTPADITFSRESGLTLNEESGDVVGIGDFNGDHISDILVSYSKGVLDSDHTIRERMVRYGIFYGKPNPREPIIVNIDKRTPDLTLHFDLRIISFISTVGDVNGDQVDDLLLFERFEENGLGNIRILFGSQGQQPAHLDVDRQTPDILIINPTPIRFAPMAVRAADLNGDGVKDLILAEDILSAGHIYGVFGPFAPGRTVDLGSATSDIVITDNSLHGSQLLPAADFNGDGRTDIIVARFAEGSPASLGSLHFEIVFGGAAREVSLDEGQSDAIYDAGSIGGSFATGDINGDGKADLLIGRTARFEGPPLTSGWIDVIFGSPTLHGPIDHADAKVSGLPPTDAFGTATQASLMRRLVAPMVAKDINGDGFADIIFGTRDTEESTDEELHPGRTHVIFGSADIASVSLEREQQDLTITFGKRQRGAGGAVNVGDFNGDGLGDLLTDGPDIFVYFSAPLRAPQITLAKYRSGSETLTITGTDFTGAARVEINGVSIDLEATFRPDQNQLVVNGSRAQLNLQEGKNQVTVIRRGARSNTIKIKMK